MGYAALDAIDDAIDATKGFLLPFDRGTWLRLAVIMFFVTGGGGVLNNAGNAGQFAGNGDPGTAPGAGAGTVMPDIAFGAVAIAVAGFAVLFVFLMLLASPIMEFVFVESLFEREVHVRRYFSRNVGNGLRLLGFQIAVVLAAGVFVVGLFLVGLLVAGGLDSIAASLGLLVLAFPLTVLLVIAIGIVNGFTTVFVVPIMLAEDRGLLSAWSRLWSSITSHLAEYLVYLVVSVLLGIGVGIVGSIVMLFALALAAIPFGLVAFGVYTFAAFSTAGIAVYAVLGLGFLVVALLVGGLVQAPLQSFLRYYAMLVLGGIDADLDPIPEIREGLRDDDAMQ
ncbi:MULTISPECIES: DUF7544 domain-containing protein [Halomicrobium]|uniref:Glycerophosphoryl diester phosphodiesterase membrane domain-containing protein n=2 Tax=Halomicrobium mukohataei TaxID=57705 RepID=C7NZ24_HALMD|nr:MULTISPECIES: DUF4013 domain-containing protein [Halomicrobium]ACV46710.1 conserved hypothetical protein [Halomicrobium mukohataei DSM 12286]QCD65219.1 hypothetical protein E5139_06045 [Halomicrobium mukohataei]QFR20025.1 hypothetical protein GBQ70_06040 [Halomicrobium sp. ZPS1]